MYVCHTVGCLSTGGWLMRVQLDPCNREVDISFTFNGCEVKISPSALNYGQVSKDSEYCLGGVASAGADYGERPFDHHASKMVS